MAQLVTRPATASIWQLYSSCLYLIVFLLFSGKSVVADQRSYLRAGTDSDSPADVSHISSSSSSISSSVLSSSHKREKGYYAYRRNEGSNRKLSSVNRSISDSNASPPTVAMFITYFRGYSAEHFATILSTCVLSSPHIQWFIVTDIEENNAERYYPKPWPQNVHLIALSMEQLSERLVTLLDYNPKLSLPSHIPYIRATFGALFHDKIANFTFWGWSSMGYICGDLHMGLVNSRLYSVLTLTRENWVHADVAIVRNNLATKNAFLSVIRTARGIRNVESTAQSMLLKWRSAQPREMRFGQLRQPCLTARSITTTSTSTTSAASTSTSANRGNVIEVESNEEPDAILPTRWLVSAGIVYGIIPQPASSIHTNISSSSSTSTSSSVLLSRGCRAANVFSASLAYKDAFGAMEATSWLLHSAALYHHHDSTSSSSSSSSISSISTSSSTISISTSRTVAPPMFGQYDEQFFILTSCTRGILVSLNNDALVVVVGLRRGLGRVSLYNSSSPTVGIPTDMEALCKAISSSNI